MFISLLLLSCSVLICTASEVECILFNGCICTPDNDVRCIFNVNRSRSYEFPRRLFSNASHHINLMLINGYNFKRIPDYPFSDLTIRTLILAENNLEVLNRYAFEGVRGLSMLHVIEKKLKHIEPGVFEPLGDTLVELGIVHVDSMRPSRIDELFRETVFLQRLATFKLSHVRFAFIKEEWMAFLGNLSYLSLSNNNLSNLSADIFEYNSNLISIDLSNNRLRDLNIVFTSCSSVQSSLKEFKLRSNGIEVLIHFPSYDNLEYLDLSKNKLECIGDSVFDRLNRLNYLYLSANKIKQLGPHAFRGLENLLVLDLANNFLPKLVNISTMTKLESLDVSNQNGNLKSIEDYAFDRPGTNIQLSVDLARNQIDRFGDLSFCLRPQLRNLTLTYFSARNLHRCVLRQLGSTVFARISVRVVPNENEDEMLR